MLLKMWLLPPLINLVLVVLGLLLAKCRYLLGVSIAMLGVISLLLLATPTTSNGLLKTLSRYPALNVGNNEEMLRESRVRYRDYVVVVLGSSHRNHSPEYGREMMISDGLERIMYAAYLKERLQIPVLSTGGISSYSEVANADVAARNMRQFFHQQVDFIERKSRTTFENAVEAKNILCPLTKQKVILVTHAYHMVRAVSFFEEQGFEVVAAPTVFPDDELAKGFVNRWLPNPYNLFRSSAVLHEWLALAWYKLPKLGNSVDQLTSPSSSCDFATSKSAI